MKLLIIMQTQRCARVIAQLVAALTLVSVGTLSFAAEPDQSHIAPPSGDGWQVLSATAPTQTSEGTAATGAATAAAGLTSSSIQVASMNPSMAVASVVLPSTASSGTVPAGVLSLVITPQDVNLRNALDRWLQQQGWQLAWKIDDDLPLEFNATFTGNFNTVLTQVMQATNHMRTPTRVCEHTNNVIRVIARAANCQE
jgi:Toxin co-regulated pilus biosynthesis protein Q